MVWGGCHKLVVVEVEDDGRILKEFTIMPGEEVPEKAMELLKQARDIKQHDDQFIAEHFIDSNQKIPKDSEIH